MDQYAGTRSWVSKLPLQPLNEQATQGPSRLPTPPSSGSATEQVQPVTSISAKDWNLNDLLGRPGFKSVKRVSAMASLSDITGAIEEHELLGEPLIIEHFHRHKLWPQEMFSVDWLLQNHGGDMCSVRNVKTCKDSKMPLSEYIAYTRAAASDSAELLYDKDAECPPEWRKWVDTDGPVPLDLRPHGPSDLFRHLPEQEQVESLMCYLGVADTFTPCHKDLCASSGHNIMSYTENNGSSFWFLTKSSDSSVVSSFFQDELQTELDWENRIVTVEQFAKATFTIFVAEQKLGDMVLVPPRSCHQVVNKGGLTIKTSWSRMTIRGLSAALQHELPMYRRVCRPEQYRVKFIVYRSLLQYVTDLKRLVADTSVSSKARTSSHSMKIKRLAEDVRALTKLFDFILCEESHGKKSINMPTIFSGVENLNVISHPLSPSKHSSKPPQRVRDGGRETISHYACDFCGGDIFQSFFECHDCRIPEDEAAAQRGEEPTTPASKEPGDGLLICAPCYAEGRTCRCGDMHPARCRPISVLLKVRNNAMKLLQQVEPGYKNSMDESGEYIRVFEAGLKLAGARREFSKSTGKCRFRHAESRDHLLSCSLCHHATCFAHILQLGIHSAEALVLHGESIDVWHARHREAKASLKRGRNVVQDAENANNERRFGERLAAVAVNFPTCRSLNPGYTRHGWYDTPYEHVHREEDETAVPHQVADDLLTATREMSPDIDVLLAPESNVQFLIDQNVPVVARPSPPLSDLSDPPPSPMDGQVRHPNTIIPTIASAQSTESSSNQVSQAQLSGVAEPDLPRPIPAPDIVAVLGPGPLRDATPDREVTVPNHVVFVEVPRRQKRALSASKDTDKEAKRRRKSLSRSEAIVQPIDIDEEKHRLANDYAPSLAASSTAAYIQPHIWRKASSSRTANRVSRQRVPDSSEKSRSPVPHAEVLEDNLSNSRIRRRSESIVLEPRVGGRSRRSSSFQHPVQEASSSNKRHQAPSSVVSPDECSHLTLQYPTADSISLSTNKQDLIPSSAMRQIKKTVDELASKVVEMDAEGKARNVELEKRGEDVKALKQEVQEYQKDVNNLRERLLEASSSSITLKNTLKIYESNVSQLKKQLEEEKRDRENLEQRMRRDIDHRMQSLAQEFRRQVETPNRASDAMQTGQQQLIEESIKRCFEEVLQTLQEKLPPIDATAHAICNALPVVLDMFAKVGSLRQSSLPVIPSVGNSCMPSVQHDQRFMTHRAYNDYTPQPFVYGHREGPSSSIHRSQTQADSYQSGTKHNHRRQMSDHTRPRYRSFGSTTQYSDADMSYRRGRTVSPALSPRHSRSQRRSHSPIASTSRRYNRSRDNSPHRHYHPSRERSLLEDASLSHRTILPRDAPPLLSGTVPPEKLPLLDRTPASPRLLPPTSSDQAVSDHPGPFGTNPSRISYEPPNTFIERGGELSAVHISPDSDENGQHLRGRYVNDRTYRSSNGERGIYHARGFNENDRRGRGRDRGLCDPNVPRPQTFTPQRPRRS